MKKGEACQYSKIQTAFLIKRIFIKSKEILINTIRIRRKYVFILTVFH